MVREQVLIVSSQGDPHAEDVLLKLTELKQDAFLLNTDDIPLRASFCARSSGIGGRWRGRFAFEDGRPSLDFERVRSIWWRRPAEFFGLPADLPEQQREFARVETDHAFRGTLACLDCYWISYPESIRQGNWKIEQLHRAARFGFEVPRTIVTTDPEMVRGFYDECSGEMVFKVLTDPYLAAVRMSGKHPDQELGEIRETKTTRITQEHLQELESVRLVPCLFQEYVRKQFELRITVIGDEIFAAAIDSQAKESTALDWRNWADGGLEIEYSVAQLPEELSELCIRFVHSYGLNFGALDLIVTPDGRYVFLENNPNGQFIWVEKLVPTLRMTDALAACLVRGANS